MDRWREIRGTSPSGKALFCCCICGRVSPVPIKVCVTKAHELPSWDPLKEKECSEVYAAMMEPLQLSVYWAAVPRRATLLQKLRTAPDEVALEAIYAYGVAIISYIKHCDSPHTSLRSILDVVCESLKEK